MTSLSRYLEQAAFSISISSSVFIFLQDLLKMLRYGRKAYRKGNTAFKRDDSGKICNKINDCS